MKTVSLLLIFIVLSACAPKEPQGPAERIGRGIDQMLQGAREMDEEYQERERARRSTRTDSELEPITPSPYDREYDREYDRDRARKY